MKVYFGSTKIVEKPQTEMLKNRSNFGKGFYTSIDKDVAEYWAEVIADQNSQETEEKNNLKKYLNVYEFEESEDSKMEKFDFGFIQRKENDEKIIHGYDIIKGPVIDEKLLNTIEEYKKNMNDSKEDLLNMILLYKSINEISFHTDRALEKLKFLYAEEIE